MLLIVAGMIGKHHLAQLFSVCKELCELFCLDWAGTSILLISASE
jgi:hypothetical protein